MTREPAMTWPFGHVLGTRLVLERTRPAVHGLAPAAGGTMLAVGRTVVGGRTEFFEFLRIEARADGLVLIAQPSGGPGVEFRGTPCAPADLRFESPTHDSPQRIHDRRVGATIHVDVGGKGRHGGWQGQEPTYRAIGAAR